VNTRRLERALQNAGFRPDSEQVWRWRVASEAVRAEVKVELLADLDSQANQVTVRFDDCERLGAVNLRGTGHATQDIEFRTLSAKVGEDLRIPSHRDRLLSQISSSWIIPKSSSPRRARTRLRQSRNSAKSWLVPE